MIEKIFLDTVGLIAILNKSDNYHKRACEVYIGFTNVKLITSDLVLYELANALSKPKFKTDVVGFIRCLQNSSSIEIVYTQDFHFEEGLKRYQNFKDKDWGLIDCVSFEIMNAKNISLAFTADHHFEQAGFEILL